MTKHAKLGRVRARPDPALWSDDELFDAPRGGGLVLAERSFNGDFFADRGAGRAASHLSDRRKVLRHENRVAELDRVRAPPGGPVRAGRDGPWIRLRISVGLGADPGNAGSLQTFFTSRRSQVLIGRRGSSPPPWAVEAYGVVEDRLSSVPSQGSSTKGRERPCSIRRRLRSSQNVVRRPVEPAALFGHGRDGRRSPLSGVQRKPSLDPFPSSRGGSLPCSQVRKYFELR